MQERRKFPRKNLMAYSQVFDLYEGRLLGYLADINPTGAMIIGEKAMEMDEKMTLQFEVPELADMDVKRLILPARVAWCQPDISPSFQNIGVEFMEVSAEQTKIIEAIMESYEFRHETPKYPYRVATKR